MKFGLHLGIRGPVAHPDSLKTIALEAEELGFGYLGFSYRSEGGVNGTFEVIYSGDLFTNNANTADVSSYSVANLRFGREFSFDRWMIRPYAGINNLLDERYNSNIRINAWGGRYYEPAPERHLYVGVVVNFRK